MARGSQMSEVAKQYLLLVGCPILWSIGQNQKSPKPGPLAYIGAVASMVNASERGGGGQQIAKRGPAGYPAPAAQSGGANTT